MPARGRFWGGAALASHVEARCCVPALAWLLAVRVAMGFCEKGGDWICALELLDEKREREYSLM